ncbi:MAG: bacillithiol biosynthesis cysteine-adding enzyme BshC [Gemmatimonadales bacterium]
MSIRIVSTPIVGSPLAGAAVRGEPSAWFAARPRSDEEWKARAEMARQSLVSADWLAALSPAFAASGAAAERLARAAKSGFAVTAGQQPGLFGGPLYTWWKALSAVALADRLEKTTGLPVVPIYWAATDDSDLAEASWTVVATADGAERIEMHADASGGASLAQVPLGDLSRQIERLAEAAGSASNPAVLEIVRRAYSPEKTVGGAFVELLRSILEPLGVAVLDAAHPCARAAAFPILRRALERADAIEDSLASRSRELKQSGHSPQVKLVKGRTLVFAEQGGRRDRISMRDAAENPDNWEPGSLGPNVLLRPIVETMILPTVAYVGGPAEIAYFAQVTAVSDALEVPAPLAVPRWSGVVIEPKIDRILERYGLTLEDFRDPHAVETRMARASVPEELRAQLESLESAVARSVDDLTGAPGADLVSPAVLDGLRRDLSRRLARLERRFSASVKRRGNEALRDVAIARGALFPFGAPQERALNLVPLLARYGDDLFSAVMMETRKHATTLA